MKKEEFITTCNEKLKLIRTEYDFSQEKTAHILGLSKKTIVEIEKGRSSLGWMGSVTLCTIFDSSEILSAIFGGKPTDIIMALAFDGEEPVYRQTKGGKVFWKSIEEQKGFKIQQNIISQHYRILNKEGRRMCSSFEYDNIKKRFEEVQDGQ